MPFVPLAVGWAFCGFQYSVGGSPWSYKTMYSYFYTYIYTYTYICIYIYTCSVYIEYILYMYTIYSIHLHLSLFYAPLSLNQWMYRVYIYIYISTNISRLQTGPNKMPVRAECDNLVAVAGVVSMSNAILPAKERSVLVNDSMTKSCFTESI